MAKKNAAAAPKKEAPSAATTSTPVDVEVPPPAKPTVAPVPSKRTPGTAATWDQVLQNIYTYYMKETPQRTKLIDVFLAFLVAVGAIQFLYCILAGNFPFNAFLSGFSATVGQFVLTVSLRIQSTEANKTEFPSVSPERAFADYVFCSLILHFFCVNFIN
ncbi:oligosaccharyl transferase [Stachybotrys elegans]|uniref:Dolichyl-diphosphooligosaccharide--protein glycosyltransferase subunit OST2 n=1 Tax=Stachybotrys elegans TaxID=80388 RepID=A0A8K0T257_9HYPO|nr:oligosaccharyl transferase [Stachybotrys elegans]